MLGAVAGSVIGITLILLGKYQADKVIPFGPFLALGSLVNLFYGPDLIAWYFGMLHL
jgi:leader peptidase (prepilin peptidase)/N-methyltransferase